MEGEIILVIIGAITTAGTSVVAYVIRRLNRADTRQAHELETTRLQRDQLQDRVTILEKDLERLEPVEAQLRVVYKMVEDLQTWKKQAEKDIDGKDTEIARLRDREVEAMKCKEALKLVENENKTMLGIFKALGLELAKERKTGPPTTSTGKTDKVKDILA